MRPDTKSRAVLGESELDTLDQQIHGEVLHPGTDEYDASRTIWNAMIDRYPAVVLRPTGAADVMTVVRVAREHDLPLSVKGNGHNVAGNAICDSGITVDLSGMDAVRVDPRNRTVRVGPGATLRDVDHETQAFGLATPLGFVSETGIAGLTLGGGFGYLSRKYGMTVDNLRSVDLVTADGELVHASEDENRELFWGIRGGGGNFGIVTSFEFELHEVGPEILAGLIFYPASDAHRVLRGWRDVVADIPDELTVWVITLTAPPAPFIPEEYHGETVVAVLPVFFGELAHGDVVLEPLFELGDPLGDNVERRSYAAWQQFFDEANASGLRNYWKSLNFAELSDEAIDTCLDYGLTLPTPETKFAIAHLGGAITRVDADATAYPHRDMEFLVNMQARWDDPARDDECIAWAREGHRALLDHSTDGTYMNFISEETGEEEFAYRENYDRLVELKRQYDPENRFRLNQNVKPVSGRE